MKPWHYMDDTQVNQLAAQALDSAARTIRDTIGGESGDLAGLFFSGSFERDILAIFRQYILAELRDKGVKQ